MYLLTEQKIQSNSAEDFLIRLGNHQTKREQSVKYLGVIVDEMLNWSSHLKQIETKLAKKCHLQTEKHFNVKHAQINIVLHTHI